jgi:L-asparaginase
MKMMKVAIIVTGGTFDKEYDELTGALYFKRTHVSEMLALGRCRLSIRLEIAMLKDSLTMTAADLLTILKACRKSPESKVIITHGTDTMEQTARLLGPALSGKTVVLTGAMIPYRFGSSDGMFNLGCSIGLVQALPPGVFVVMNGQYFDWRNVTKNRREGYFHAVKSPLPTARIKQKKGRESR